MSVNEIDDTLRVKYQDEFIDDYALKEGKFQRLVTAGGVMEGTSTCRFEVVDPAGRARPRGRDGLLKKNNLGINTVTAEVQDEYDGYQITDFDAFKGNPNIRSKQVERIGQALINSQDHLIYTTLTGAAKTYNGGTPVTLNTKGTVFDIAEEMYEQNIPDGDGKLYGIITQRQMNFLKTIQEFTSADYVDVKPIKDGLGPDRYLDFGGVRWSTWNAITGKRTANATGIVFHESSLAYMATDPDPDIGYNGEHKYYWSNGGIFHASARLLERGVMVLPLKDDVKVSA